MRRLALSDNPVGRKLARAVRNAASTVLLERDVVLDARMIGCLVSLGITHVYATNDANDPAANEHEQAVRAEVALAEQRRFGDVADDPLLAALLAATIEYKVGERLAAGDWATAPVGGGCDA